MNTRRLPLLLLFAVLLVCGLAYWKLTRTPPSHEDDRVDANPTSGDNSTSEIHRKLLGVWQDEYQGKRTMTLNPNGTGTMLVELSGVQAFLVASKLRFDMKWSLDGKKFTKKTVGGEPADKVNLILNTMGDTAEDTILEITEDQLLLLDKNGKTKYDWRRVNKDGPTKE